MQQNPLPYKNRLPVARESLIDHSLTPHFGALGAFASTRRLEKSLVWRSLGRDIQKVMTGLEYGFYAPSVPAVRKPFYRAVGWNIERGMHFDGILGYLKNHPELSTADLLYLTETDIGMARSENRNVARELALELNMNYFFAPSYLNFCKGNLTEAHVDGDNTLGLHGNAILSRYPLENLRAVPLMNCKDKMRGHEKRVGGQKTLIVDVLFPARKVKAVLAHLDAHSSQRQRAAQMRSVLSALKDVTSPILIGGDWNTSTYNARHAFFAFLGFWNKVFRGVDYVIDEHYPYPYRFFDRFLFRELEREEFDYLDFNEIGVGTFHYDVEDINGNRLVREVVPEWCRRVMVNTLARHGGKVSLKLDWFAGRGLSVATDQGASPPKVIPGLKSGGSRVSDHDPILVDIEIYNSA